MEYIVLIGRILYSAIFISASLGHFSQEAITYASAKAVPLASVLVPLSGICGFLGGLSILIGFKARYGAWLLVIFLIPVTLMMHGFWKIDDPIEATLQKTLFMKNLSMLGAGLLISYFGSGPMSVDKK